MKNPGSRQSHHGRHLIQSTARMPRPLDRHAQNHLETLIWRVALVASVYVERPSPEASLSESWVSLG